MTKKTKKLLRRVLCELEYIVNNKNGKNYTEIVSLRAKTMNEMELPI